MTLVEPTRPHPVPAEATAAPERAGRIETQGIDHIPDSERHGRPIELFWVWAGANVNYLSLVVGAAPALTGVDRALPAGMIVAAAVYATMSRIGRPRIATVG
jgi:purine-cytosine permease-like protein